MITIINRTLTLREAMFLRASNCECYNSCLLSAIRQAKAAKGINENNCSFVCLGCNVFRDKVKRKEAKHE